VRYVIKFSKESGIKFVSHLDLLRTIQRIVRRAGLPVEYSRGFNPHMTMSIAQPLSVGIYSEGEYMDTVFTEELEGNYIKTRLNDSAPEGIRFLKVIGIRVEGDRKIPQTAALVEAADYEIRIKYAGEDKLHDRIKEMLAQSQWLILKKSKSGEKTVDIRPMVKEFRYKTEGNTLVVNTLLASGSRENLSPELLSNYIKSNTEGALEETFVEIKRKEMYTQQGGTLLPISEFVERK
jgi:radical SAM-linked protein